MKLNKRINTGWSHNLAYAIGLIASDGNLHSDKRHIQFCSKDLEMIQNFKKALGIINQISKFARGGEKDKKYFSIKFEDKSFYQFLNKIGLSAKKSKTIASVDIPDEYFSDFLRGLFDGDGTFYTFQDKRWPNSYGYQISIASSSKDFLTWLKNLLSSNYGTKGFIRPGAGVFNLRYVKKDTIRLYLEMYKNKGLFLRRKYDKISNILLKDKLYLKYAGVA